MSSALQDADMAGSTWPRTLQEAVVHFSDPDTAFAEMVKLRWPQGMVTCPTCGRTDVYFTESRRIWQCRHAHTRRQFSVKVGSVMEDSALGIDKWLIAVWLITNARNGVSSYELARAIGVTQKSAWFLLHRIRLAMQDDTADRQDRTSKGTGRIGTVAVQGLLARYREDGHSTNRVRRR